ncbi:hypothetical protein [Lactiplantibacillus plantarum]|uniref:hypothetical protein n=1 Tax=Lactiplantibacillus plantarum TaxID=1590 RepID=UPI000BAAD85D|nr:hypothetical protein [Lactiplantibacillus plantarum]ASX20684.1 hypothetical protein BGV74_02365 [Lactiplantibacillus plantarum]WMY70197.1 hypothetical protein RF634_13075 [Lactiplantibacillus plantarum]
MYIFLKDDQTKLRMQLSMNRMNRKVFSIKSGISMPTIKKVLDADCPLAITQGTANRIKKWQIEEAKHE